MPWRCERAAHVGQRHLVSALEPLHVLVGRQVDEHAARDQRFHVLDAELAEARARVHLGRREAVVEHALRAAVGELDLAADVAEAVELCADLADFGRKELVVIEHAIRACGLPVATSRSE